MGPRPQVFVDPTEVVRTRGSQWTVEIVLFAVGSGIIRGAGSCRAVCRAVQWDLDLLAGPFGDFGDCWTSYIRGVEQARGDKRADEKEEEKEEDGGGLGGEFKRRPPDRVSEITQLPPHGREMPLKPLHVFSHSSLLNFFLSEYTQWYLSETRLNRFHESGYFWVFSI